MNGLIDLQKEICIITDIIKCLTVTIVTNVMSITDMDPLRFYLWGLKSAIVHTTKRLNLCAVLLNSVRVEVEPL